MPFTIVLRFWPHAIHASHPRAYVVLHETKGLVEAKAMLRALMMMLDAEDMTIRVDDIRPREITTPAGLATCYDLVTRSSRGRESIMQLGIDADGARRAMFIVGEVLPISAMLILDADGAPVYSRSTKVPKAVGDMLEGDFKTAAGQFNWTRRVNRALDVEVGDPMVMQAGFASQAGNKAAICKSHNGMAIAAYWMPVADGDPKIYAMQPGVAPEKWDLRRFYELYKDPSTHNHIRNGVELLAASSSFDRLAIMDAGIFAEAYGIAGL